MDAITKILKLEHKRFAMRYASVENEFLQQTQDPKKSEEGRGLAVGAFESISNEVLLGDEMKEALADFNKNSDHDFWHEALVEEIASEREKKQRINSDLLASKAKLAAEAFPAWVEAKETNNWSLFAPYVQKALDVAKRIAENVDPHKDAYDISLEAFEPGSSQKLYNELFQTIDTELLDLLKQIQKAPQLELSVVDGTFDLDTQQKLACLLLQAEGVDMDALTLAESEHPFTLGIDPGHVYVTGHRYENSLASNLFTILHEGGHALYQQNISKHAAFTSLGDYASMGIDEAQSRFFENYIGRSWAFMDPLLAMLSSLWPAAFDSVTPEELYQALNVVSVQNFIRCDADELTYPFHVQVRYEVEKELFSGTLAVNDVPARWNELFKRYLGLDVTEDKLGCLQDVHWSAAEFGYFPTYVLGSVYGAQLLGAMQNDLAFDELVSNGELAPIRAWLKEKIWQWGKSKTTSQMLMEATGSQMDAMPFCSYVKEKYQTLYSI